MKALWVCFLLQTLQIYAAQAAFGTPYLTHSRTCHQWGCINTKLGLPNALPPREQYDIALRAMLPDGEWQDVVNKVLDACYGERARVYTNTCPGQALLQCTVENLINNCPASSQRKDDACSPINSFAGMDHMFSQSVYPDIEKNMPEDRRPAWFLKNYFNMKCCNLPPLFNASDLAECKFKTVMSYYTHTNHVNNFVLFGSTKTYTTASPSMQAVRVVNPDESTMKSQLYTTASPEDASTIGTPDDNSIQDPLDCCDMSDFIQTAWRSECDFNLSWDRQMRLTIKDSMHTSTVPPSTTTTTAAPLSTIRDVKIVPVSSENLTCVFNKLDMLTTTGDVKLELFMKLLDNYTKDHEEFSKAKARVITECLTKPLLTYDGESHIEKVIACTLDLLSENCPYYNKKNDSCKNPVGGMVCQISSSRYRAKTRRTLCSLPNLVPDRYLKECGLSSLSREEFVVQKIASFKKYGRLYTKIGCLDASESTMCLLKKMGVINKYNFMDYFKMKDRIRQHTNGSKWSTDTCLNAFTYSHLYNGHCNSPKKLLNVIDSMLMTCPIARRAASQFCNEIFGSTPASHFLHIYAPLAFTSKTEKPKIYYKHTPLYNYGLLASGAVPPVNIIDVKPVTSRPLLPVRTPVYMSLRISPKSSGLATNMLRNAGSLTRDPQYI